MISTQLSNTVLDWEHRLEIEEQQRKSRRFEDDFNSFRKVSQSPRPDRKSIFARLFNRAKEPQPVYPCGPQERCREA